MRMSSPAKITIFSLVAVAAVFLVRADLHMLRIDAESVVTDVIDLQTFWDRAFMALVRNLVDILTNAPDLNRTVSVIFDSAQP